MRALKFAGVAIIGVIVTITLVLFIVGIPSSFVTSAIQDRVERESGYRVVISGATRLGLWPLSVTVHDITVRDPKESDTTPRLTLGSVQLNIPFGSLLSGHPQIAGVTVDHPVVHVPLLRERIRQPAASLKPAPSSNAVTVDHVVVKEGTVVFANRQDRVENRIDGINADFSMSGDRKIRIAGSARASDSPLKFDLKATAPAPPLERQTIPVELTIDAPALQSPLSAKAEVRLNGSILMINGLTGKLGNDEFNGWASADLTSKPLVKLDLDFQRLELAKPAARPTPAAPSWNDAPIDFSFLVYHDAQIRVSAADLRIGDTVFSPASIDATLASGVLKAQLSHIGLYGGVGDGDMSIDASAGDPRYTMRADLHNVRALPLLKSLADFDKLDGKMQAKVALQASGASQRAIVSSLSGTVFANFQDGAIQGLNVAKMIRSLTSTTLSGWQESSEQSTDLTQLSASFRVDKGQASNSDLALVGPLVRMTGAGTVDLGAGSLAYRVEPKIVMSIEGQGSAAKPAGLGVPVIIEGSWSEPRIYPDMAGIFDNPEAAFAKLKDMGKGLFGANSGVSEKLGGVGETLGKLIQQGLGRDPPAVGGRSPAPGISPAPGGATPPLPDTETLNSESMKSILKNLFNR